MAFEAASGALRPSRLGPPRLSYRWLVGMALDAIAYGAASVVALAVDWGSLVGLTSVFHVDYLAAACIAFSLGLIVAYLLSVRVVFKDRSRYGARGEIVGFLVTGVIGLALNQVLIFAFVGGLGLPVAIAKAPTVAFVFTFNFLSRRLLLFYGRSA
ncbi:MAG: GtrA family protein [Rhodoblastus sp.]